MRRTDSVMPGKGVVIGTAGHIDHGKTALVKLLTGIDTDRLKEEKERGISIDLGFAHLTLPSGVRAGIVDVPGHERFVRNMLAGACGIDLVLFVIAADEGVMPQTTEHLNIVDVLRVHGGVVALTKTDLVDAAWLDMVSADVAAALEGTVLEGAAIVPVSAASGEGKDALLAALDEAVSRIPERGRAEFTRLPIDRVFTVEGFGTVVTGTLWSGRLKVGDNLVVLPQGKSVRVRNVQVFGRDVPEAVPGERVAVAVHGVSREDLARGDWLFTPSAAEPSSMVDVRFELLKDAPRSLSTRARIRFHLGASEVIGRVHLLDKGELKPGESALAQLRLESPVVAVQGDRFVVRSYSPQVTIGGGSVLVVHAVKHRKKDTDVVETLSLMEKGSPRDRIGQAVRAAGAKGLAVSDVARAAGMPETEVVTALSELVAEGAVFRVGGGLLHTEHMKKVADGVAETLAEYQASYPLRWGMTKGELRNRFSATPQDVFVAALDSLSKAGRLFAREDRYRVDSPDVALSPEEKALKERVEVGLRDAGLNVPYVKELAAGVPEEKLNDLVQMLVEDGKLVKITTDLFFHADTMREAEALVRKMLAASGKFQVSEFKDAAKTSRKYAVPLLEYFDRKGVTRRQGDVRVAGGK
ncbi:MAG: selenocysteine-specific translation elongation factor [Candidatus Eisenbacteria bacterium]|nr:selenocysteine-specific translation elongation factor [Candidatus Eisenbacteria bacterium]